MMSDRENPPDMSIRELKLRLSLDENLKNSSRCLTTRIPEYKRVYIKDTGLKKSASEIILNQDYTRNSALKDTKIPRHKRSSTLSNNTSNSDLNHSLLVKLHHQRTCKRSNSQNTAAPYGKLPKHLISSECINKPNLNSIYEKQILELMADLNEKTKLNKVLSTRIKYYEERIEELIKGNQKFKVREALDVTGFYEKIEKFEAKIQEFRELDEFIGHELELYDNDEPFLNTVDISAIQEEGDTPFYKITSDFPKKSSFWQTNDTDLQSLHEKDQVIFQHTQFIKQLKHSLETILTEHSRSYKENVENRLEIQELREKLVKLGNK